MRSILPQILFGVWLALGANHAPAAEGVNDREIRIGMSNALSGKLAEYGKGILTGAKVYFDKINAEGGILGRKLLLISYDDEYDPKKTLETATRLVENDHVFALFGFFGTPTVRAVFPYAVRTHVPFLFPRSGSTYLRKPVTREVFTLNAGYSDEAEELVRYLVEDLKIDRIGLFEQDDALGDEGKRPVIATLAKHGLTLIGDGKYKRDSSDVAVAVASLREAAPKAVITFGFAKQTLAFVRESAKLGFKPVLGIPTPAGTQELIAQIAPAENVYRTEVMPELSDSKYKLIAQYKKDMTAAGLGGKFDQNSLRSYASAMVLVEALRRAGVELDREKLVAALEEMRDFDIGGLKISFSPQNHQAMRVVFTDRIKDGKIVPIKVAASPN